MLVSVLSIALMLAGTQAASPAAGVQAAPQDESTTLSTIEVEGQRRTAYDAARAFTNEILVTPPRRGIARWRTTDPICPGVVNMQRDVAQALADRIADRVIELGLQAGEPGCKANMIIVGADDGAAMASSLIEARPRAYITGIAGTSLTYRALNIFRTSDAPVRWWMLTVPLDARTGEVTVRTPDSEDAPIRRIDGAGRLRSQDINAIFQVMVVVDVNRIGTVDVGQLGDYIAMVALAQVDAQADVAGFETVLNLFQDPAGVSGLTDWDLTYLRQLYAADLSVLSASAQVGRIAGAMARAEEADDATGD
ncbi:MAG: hypothetical protein B7Y86_05325 [Brevundimonas subvibrioides]|uniref:Uncharacterized protein n=1 Tax=Brevundimonas subvibrioides TaxID=74313 RepID=A0A258HMQ3_9CAUL|nr:MAG: hypothetical protein B7Y86_05325 [Brevundimonas subvibrioides]